MTKPRLLIVDDTPQNINLLGEYLRDEYDVRIATSGQKALDIAFSTDKPDIILLDVMMPGMDGFEVMARLKDNPGTRDIPVIFLTAMGEAVDEQKGLSLGAVDYVVKPFNVDVVATRVRNHLSLRQHVQFLEWLHAEKADALERLMTEFRRAQESCGHWQAELEFLRKSR